MRTRLNLIFAAMLFAGAAIRLVNVNQPLLEYNATRQVQTAMITRNFAFNGGHFLYPEVDDQGKGPTYLIQELPIITFPVAVICRHLGYIPEWLLRSSSLFFFIIAAFLFYLLARACSGERTALVASAIFIFSPLSILMSRTFQPDMAMVLFTMLCIYFFARWMVSGSWAHFALAACGFAGAVLLKITNFYLVVPLAYLFFAWRGDRKMPLYKAALFAALVMVPICWWWLYHAPSVRNLYPNPYDTFSPGYVLESMKAHLGYAPFYGEMFYHLAGAALTPLIFAAFIYGLFMLRSGRQDGLLFFWTLSVILFLLAVPEQSKQEYYMLSIIPPAAILAARGIMLAYERIKYVRFFWAMAAAALMFTLLFAAYVAVPKFLNRFEYSAIVEAGKAAQQIMEKDALVVASHNYSQDLLYYCGRKGWPFSVDRSDILGYLEKVKISQNSRDIENIRDPIKDLEHLRGEGARYLVMVDPWKLDKTQAFKAYLLKNYKVLVRKSDQYAIFDLRQKEAGEK